MCVCVGKICGDEWMEQSEKTVEKCGVDPYRTRLFQLLLHRRSKSEFVI